MDVNVPEVGVDAFDTIEMVNGTPGCVDCGGLLAIEKRSRGAISKTRQIANAMLPEPTDDVATVQCAGCGAVLWGRGDR